MVTAAQRSGKGDVERGATDRALNHAEVLAGIARIGQGGPFVAIGLTIAVKVEGVGILPGSGVGGKDFVNPCAVVGCGPGFVGTDVRDPNDGKIALVGRQCVPTAAFRAGLPGRSAIVWVGPP